MPRLKLVPKQAPATGHTPRRAQGVSPLLDPCMCNVPGLTCLVCPRWHRLGRNLDARRRVWEVTL
jgi:hypothetical protein